MQIHDKLENSVVNGPGSRCVIWTQGCGLHCVGCHNEETWPFSAAAEVHVGELVDWVCSINGIEGVTISGGEPFQQASQLYLLVAGIKACKPELSIGIFTGYTKRELKEGRWRRKNSATGTWVEGDAKLAEEIFKHLDFAVCGRFKQLLATKDIPMCASRNQEVVYFTDRYKPEDMPKQAIEVQVSDDGLVHITGFEDPGKDGEENEAVPA